MILWIITVSGNPDLAIDGDIKDTIADESEEGEVSPLSGISHCSGQVRLVMVTLRVLLLAIAVGGPRGYLLDDSFAD